MDHTAMLAAVVAVMALALSLHGCGGSGGGPAPAPAGRLDVKAGPNGTYSLQVNGVEWFAGAAPSFRHNGRMLSVSDGSLELKEVQHLSVVGGQRYGMEHRWAPRGLTSPIFTTRVKVYGTYAVFTQTFPHGVTNTSTGDRDGLISAYPVLTPKWKNPKGVVSYQGDMAGKHVATGRWGAKSGSWQGLSSAPSIIGEGIKGTGPVVVFDSDLKTSLVLSPFSNFMAANQKIVDGALAYGIMGGVTEVPKNYSIATIVSLGSGVNAAMEAWGDVLLKQHGKERYAYKRDLAMQYLGYSTDNGAYYYYTTEPQKNYQDTLVDVIAYAKKTSIPYKYFLLDSWWYLQSTRVPSVGDTFRVPSGGVKTWEARPDIFPDGMKGFWEKTHFPTMLHNRHWAEDNTYAKQNGGKYNFIIDGSGVAVPDDQQFWNDLIGNKTKVGAFMYEQDWLDVEFDTSKSLGESATLGRTWMMQMNGGAVYANQTIQMCMSHVRHILQSVEMPAVTNARASDDYQHQDRQWDTGTTAILAHAVGIAPSKDNYWSTRVQPGSAHYPNATEECSRLQSAVSTLTSGPVAPSDKIGYSNVSLIMRCCDTSGRLLSADRPATEIDMYFMHMAGFGGVDGHMWATHATVSGQKFSYVIGISLRSEYNLSTGDLGYSSGDRLVAVQADHETTHAFDFGSPLRFAKCGTQDFQLYLVAPPTGDFTLLGEPDKWISVSPQRFSDLTKSGSRASVKVHGQAGEKVVVRWANSKGKITSAACTLSAAGVATSQVSASGVTCSSSSSEEILV